MKPERSEEVRRQLVDALHLDLVGPWPGHGLEEELIPGWKRPSNWYLTGFLLPSDTPPERRADADEDEEEGPAPEDGGLAEESSEERRAARKAYFPSSMGVSFLVGGGTRELEVEMSWGDYSHEELEGDGERKDSAWRREPRREVVRLALGGERPEGRVKVPGSGGLEVQFVGRRVGVDGFEELLPKETRSVSVFLVNHRPARKSGADEAYAFQARLEVRAAEAFVPRPDLRGARSEDWDERVADLHYADTPEYAVGHGVAADWELVDGECRRVWTTWIPGGEVERTETVDVPGVELSMEELCSLADGAAVRSALGGLVDAYRNWIAARRAEPEGGLERRAQTAEQLLAFAEHAATRIERGIAMLAEDPEVLDAFRVANRAVSRALKRRLGIGEPRWRSFQLAFVLLNLPGVADPGGADRRAVDLLFFPTGGGKTEAYLGLAAVAMVLRRLRRPAAGAVGGAGVSVIMRYTLRLLTLDQLARAAGLMCALELERQADPARYGTWPFEIGLWVGKAATPNVLGRKGENRPDSARAKVLAYQANPRGNPSPIPLENCPWCGRRFERESFALVPNSDQPRDLRIFCRDVECEFSGGNGLPVVAVDEVLYRRLPAFLIATVDKFASLPWVAQSGALLGGAQRFDDEGFYRAGTVRRGKTLPGPLPPPDLVLQDELHLITGPLGTMAGLYETAVEALCLRGADGQQAVPKIVASTATVRRAGEQVQALFARNLTHIFPPPGPDRRDSFFARTVPASETPARLYLGIAAQGRNPKEILRRVWLALMGAAQRAYREWPERDEQENPADPYMTVLGYFNSLRELGGARRILEEQIRNTVKGIGSHRRLGGDPGLFRDRKEFTEVVELTSRVSTSQVAEARRKLEASFADRDNRVDCAIATNMISVGLDIPRLGLMVVAGQPKTHSEYIQATSRVGRVVRKPGLVVTLLNFHKPRDRSHYERFRHYHETFYRSVEVGSVTPFSPRALDRGLAGALVGLSRHLIPDFTPPDGVAAILTQREALERKLRAVFLERVRSQPFADDDERDERLRSVQNRLVDLLDAWRTVVEDFRSKGAPMQYQPYELDGPRPLLQDMLERAFDPAALAKFRAPRSLRDVEPEVNLYLAGSDEDAGSGGRA